MTEYGDTLQQFIAVTGADEQTAGYYLEACGGDLSAAIGMHIDSSNTASAAAAAEFPVPGSSSLAVTSSSASGKKLQKRSSKTSSSAATPIVPPLEDFVRSPIPQKKEVLVQENITYGGLGKRRKPQSVFDHLRDFQAEARQHELSVNGSDVQSKHRTLEELFRPPIDLLHRGSFKSACEAASSSNKWLLANIQNVQEFSCQVLNRDLWSNSAVKEVVKEHFILWQAYSDSEDGRRYMVLYKVTDWPYVAAIDPRTGEKLISWNKLEANSFCELMSEFLLSHPVPDLSEVKSPPLKKQKLETQRSIVDASEDSQMSAAITASLHEKSFKSSVPTSSSYDISNDGDDEGDGDADNCLYSSFEGESDLETFSDSDNSRPSCLLIQQQNSVNIPIIDDNEGPNVSGADGFSISGQRSEDVKVASSSTIKSENPRIATTSRNSFGSTNENDEERIESTWKTYLGPDTDAKSLIVLRFPDGQRQKLSIPSSSKLMSIVSYVNERGYPSNSYELVTTFPKRKLSELDANDTLRNCGINSQETIFIQEF